MTTDIQIYDVLKPRDYKGKTRWQAVATAFPTKSGAGLSFDLPDGVTIAGRVLIMPRTDKNAVAEPAAEDEQGE